jgi:hypothetical protein
MKTEEKAFLPFDANQDVKYLQNSLSKSCCRVSLEEKGVRLAKIEGVNYPTSDVSQPLEKSFHSSRGTSQNKKTATIHYDKPNALQHPKSCSKSSIPFQGPLRSVKSLNF